MKSTSFYQFAAGIFAATFIVIFWTLWLADTWPASGSGGLPPTSCALQFPVKWFGCVLSAHEALAGGLIGAGGVIFAAWITAYAVWQQINDARETTQRAEESLRLRYLTGTRDLVEYFNTILKPFPDLLAHPTRVDHLVELEALYKSGNLSAFSGNIPPQLQIRADACWQKLDRLRQLNEELRRTYKQTLAAPNASPALFGAQEKDESELNDNVRLAITEIRGYQGQAQLELDQMHQTAALARRAD